MALGAALGELLLGKRMGNRALAWGALFGTLPDLDSVVLPFFNTASLLWWHRGPSHSLLVMVVVSYVLAPWLVKLWKRDKISKTLAGGFVFAVWSTHVLIDCFTVYGTSVGWPFPVSRVAFNHLFIIDFCFTMPLVVALVWLAFLRSKKQLAKRRRLNAWGLGLAAGYALLSVGMKFVAAAGFDADLVRRGVTFQRRMEAPTPFNILLWRAVVDRGDEFWVGYRTVFESHTTPVRWTIYPKGRAALAGMEESAGSQDPAMVHRRVVDCPPACQGRVDRRPALRRVTPLGRQKNHGGQPLGLRLEPQPERAGRPPRRRCIRLERKRAKPSGAWPCA